MPDDAPGPPSFEHSDRRIKSVLAGVIQARGDVRPGWGKPPDAYLDAEETVAETDAHIKNEAPESRGDAPTQDFPTAENPTNFIISKGTRSVQVAGVIQEGVPLKQGIIGSGDEELVHRHKGVSMSARGRGEQTRALMRVTLGSADVVYDDLFNYTKEAPKTRSSSRQYWSDYSHSPCGLWVKFGGANICWGALMKVNEKRIFIVNGQQVEEPEFNEIISYAPIGLSEYSQIKLS